MPNIKSFRDFSKQEDDDENKKQYENVSSSQQQESYGPTAERPRTEPMPNAWQNSTGRTLSGSVVQPTLVDLSNDSEQHYGYDESGPTGVSQRVSNFFTRPILPEQIRQTQSPYQMAYESQEHFWSWNLSDSQSSSMKWYHILLLFTFPMFVGHPLSKVRRGDYLRLLYTLFTWITLVQIVYFILVLIIGGGFASTQENPAVGPSNYALQTYGLAKDAYLIKYQFHVHRLVMPLFMHAGIFHILFNLIVQLSFAFAFERYWNVFRVGFIYFVSGIAGNMLSCCLLPNSLSVGASGAIYGLLGAKIALTVCTWPKLDSRRRLNSVFFTASILFLLILTSFSAYIDWAGHLGGVFMGFFLGLSLFCFELKNRIARYISLALGIGFLVLFFAVTGLVFGFAVQPLPLIYK